MSIDYDRLRGLLQDFDQAETPYAKWESHTAISVRAVATTRELLRLRDGVEKQITHLEALLAAAEVTEHYGFAGPIQARVTELTDLLNGDTE